MPLEIFFSKLLKVNPRVGRFISGAMLALVGAAIVSGFGVDINLLLKTAFYVVIFGLVTRLLSELNGIPVTLLSWALTISFLFWLFSVAAQMSTRGGISWLPPLQCLWKPLSENCVALGAPELNFVATRLPDINQDLKDDGVIASIDRVYVQFAGSIQRSEMINFNKELLKEGWPIKWPEKGGERTVNAIGLNEVRFYHQGAVEAARHLAEIVAQISPAGAPVSIRDMSKTSFATLETQGLLEIWISN